MHCPRDPSQELVKLPGDAEAFTCDRCDGMFFTAGELDRLAEPHQGSLDTRPSTSTASPTPTAMARRLSRRRSRDEEGELQHPHRHHSRLLPDLRRVWLDSGELERINTEVRELVRANDEVRDPPMMWFAKALWTLVR